MTTRLAEMGKRYLREVFIFGFLAGLFILLIDPGALWDRTVTYVFQTRDLERAYLLARGFPIFFGPEMTGGGNLPGSLYYLILSISQIFGRSWAGAWVQMLLLAAATASLGWLFLRGHVGRSNSLSLPAGILWLGLFSYSVVTRHFFLIFINPSFLFIFVLLGIVDICRAFSLNSETERSRALVRSGLWIGLGSQIHFSIIFLFFSAIFLFIFSKRLSLPIVPQKAMVRATAVLLFCFSPYLAWLTLHRMGIDFGQQPAYAGVAEDVLPTLAHLLQAINSQNPLDTLHVVILQSLRVIPWPLIAIALTWLVSRLFLKRPDMSQPIVYAWLKPLLVCAAFGFIPFSYIFFVPIANRYGMPLHLSLLLLTVVLHLKLWSDRTVTLIYIFLSLIFLVSVILALNFLNEQALTQSEILLVIKSLVVFACLILFKVELRPKPYVLVALLISLSLGFVQKEFLTIRDVAANESNMVRWRQWEAIWQRILARTGWSLAEARERIFFVNVHIDGDPAPSFLKVAEQLKRVMVSGDRPDGYFVAMEPDTERDLSDWLLKQPLPWEIHRGLREGHIEIFDRENLFGGRLAIAPYRLKRPDLLPPKFHTWPLAYEQFPDADLLAKVKSNAGTDVLGENQYLFKWNECPDQHPYCDAGAIVNFETTRNYKKTLRVRVIGASLSQVSPWIHPLWTQAWEKPFVEVRCGHEKHKFLIADAVGYKREYLLYEPVTRYFVANNSLIAPIERTFEFECQQSVSAIGIGREATTVDQLRSYRQLASKKLEINL